MRSDNYPCGNTLREVFEYFVISPEHGAILANRLFAEGFTEDSICYAVGQRITPLVCRIGDKKFDAEFVDAVRICGTKWIFRTNHHQGDI